MTGPIVWLTDDRQAEPADETSPFRVSLVDRAADPRSAWLIALWTEARGAMPLPTREQMASRGLIRLMPTLFILRGSDDGRDFVYGLIGTELAQALGHDPTGKSIAESHIDVAERARVRRLLRDVIMTGQPRIARGLFRRPEERFGPASEIAFESVLLPILSNDRSEVRVLGGVFFAERLAART